MPGKTTRSSNLELLRILCMLLIIGDHLTGQSGIADYTTLPSSFAFCLIGCGSRIACSVFVLIGGWFLCEQPYKTRRPLSLWLSLWLYTVPVTLLCKLAGLDVSWGALRWAAFPASTRQLWFISDYLLLLLCVPLLNRLLRGLSRPAHRGLLAVLAVPLIVYPTLFGENGAVSDTAWMFLYEYLLIAYLRRWPDNRLAHLLQHRAAALGLGLGLPLLNTILRAVLETRGLTDGKAFQYMAYYRTALAHCPTCWPRWRCSTCSRGWTSAACGGSMPWPAQRWASTSCIRCPRSAVFYGTACCRQRRTTGRWGIRGLRFWPCSSAVRRWTPCARRL